MVDISIAVLIDFLTAILLCDYKQFKQLEQKFVDTYGKEVWEEYFNFRLVVVLDKRSNNWLLVQKLGELDELHELHD